MIFAQFFDIIIYHFHYWGILLMDYSVYIGTKIEKWTITSYLRKKYRIYFRCICECGRESEIPAYKLLNNTSSKSCLVCAFKKHGQSSRVKSSATRTYQTWNGLRNRCNNINNKDYKDYGARGIKVCERWNSFENFLADMGEKPKGLTLDRINNDEDYEPSNCRWATYSQQNSNQRKRRS